MKRAPAPARRAGRGPVRPVLVHPFGWLVSESAFVVGMLLSFLVLMVVVVRGGSEVGWLTVVTVAAGLVLPVLPVFFLGSIFPCTWRWSPHGRAKGQAVTTAPGGLSVPAWNAGYGRLHPAEPAWRSVGLLTLDDDGVTLSYLRGRGAQRRWERTGPALPWESILEVSARRTVGDTPRWWRHPGIEIASVDQGGRGRHDVVAVALRLTGRDRLGLARELAALMNERADQARPEAWGRYEASPAGSN